MEQCIHIFKNKIKNNKPHNNFNLNRRTILLKTKQFGVPIQIELHIKSMTAMVLRFILSVFGL